MKTTIKNIKAFVFIVLLSLSMIGCTSWPSLFVLMFSSSDNGSGLLIIPPGGGGGGGGGPVAEETPPEQEKAEITPTVTSVSSTSPSQAYIPGETIEIQITFDNPVEVSGSPQLVLNNGAIAEYSSGSGTNTLTFTYTVQEEQGEDIIGLDQNGSDALSLNGGTIKGTANGNLDASLTLTTPGGSGSLSSSATIEIDTIKPKQEPSTAITTDKEDGTYGIGAIIDITIKFTEKVTTTGNPRIQMNSAATAYANYHSGNGTDTLTFRYIVAEGEGTSDLDYDGIEALELNDGTLTDIAGNTAILTVFAQGSGMGSIADARDIVIDTTVPSVSVNNITADESVATMDFKVTLSDASAINLTVDYALVDVTTEADADYIDNSGTLSFAPGETEKTVSISINNDTLDEEDEETFRFELSNLSVGVVIGAHPGIATIQDNDDMPAISVDDVTTVEGHNGSKNAIHTISLSAASGKTIQVSYASGGGSAGIGNDYNSVAGNLVFAPGESTKTVLVAILGDEVDEFDETYQINLSGENNATLDKAIGIGTISDDDDQPTISINNASTAEGNIGSSNAAYTVALSAASEKTITINYETGNGTATAGSDYTYTSGTLEYSPGQISKTIYVPIIGDTTDEFDEDYTLTLNAANHVTILDGSGSGMIIDEDDPPELLISDATVTEGDGGDTIATYNVNLSAVSGKEIKVDYVTADGTALAGSDYTAQTGTLTFTPGDTGKTIEITIAGDTTDEENETYSINFSNPINAGLNDTNAAGIINDNDDPPTITISDVTTAEGNSGTTDASFTIELSAASEKTVKVDYDTSNNSATAGSDYTATNGTLTFNPGDTNKTVVVTTSGDVIDEVNETYQVNLSNAQNASFAVDTATGTITDDDNEPNLTIDDKSITEGDTGNKTVSYTVQLDAISGKTITLNYNPQDGTATAGNDYTLSAGNLTFTPGQTTKTITVSILGDTMDEADENYSVVLTGVTNANPTKSIGAGIISDNDPEPTISIGDRIITETNSGSTNASFTVTLAAESGKTITVDYATADGSAIAGQDYTATTGTLEFQPGETSHTLNVPVLGDSIDEAEETFTVQLSNPANVGLDSSTGTGTITDNDDPPNILITNQTTAEGNSGSTVATYTITLDAASEKTINVDYATADGDAIDGKDYTSTSGTLNFAPGQTEKTVSVTVLADVLDEVDETYSVVLSNANNATLPISPATGTISDDDDAPKLSINSKTTTEGNSGTTNATYTITLDAESGKTVTVNYTTTDGSAIAGNDYQPNAGSLTFSPGETIKSITVAIIGDTTDEIDEEYTVNLSGANHATIVDGVGEGQITDDDAPPELTINNRSTAEGNTGSSTASYTVILSAASEKEITVDYDTGDSTATAGSDYNQKDGSLTFTAGETSKNINIEILGDTIDEPDEESYTVTLSNAVNASIATAIGSGKIIDDDTEPKLSINDKTITEGDVNKNATFTVTLDAVSEKTVTVAYEIVDGSTKAGDDYVENSGTLNFPANTTTQTIDVEVIGDASDEFSETYTVVLKSPANATIDDGVGNGLINDNDDPPTISINDISIDEGDSGSKDAIYTVSVSEVSGKTIKVDYATGDVSATAGNDYTAKTGILTIDPGNISENIKISLNGDTIDEDSEDFTVTLSSPSNASIADASGTATINDDDAPPAISIDDLEITESNSGTTIATFSVNINAISSKTITVDYVSSDGSATAGPDYTATTGTLSFNPGDTTKTFNMAVKGDTLDEIDETFTINLSNPTNATISDNSATATITDDDASETLSIADVTITEGDSATKTATFTVNLSGITGRTISVDYVTADGSATVGNDYVANSGTLIFSPGDTSKTIEVTINGDELDEDNENYTVTLSNVDGANIPDPVATATITDDDTPMITIDDHTTEEGDSGSVNITYTVSLSLESSKTITVDYEPIDGSATQGSDYSLTGGTLTFSPGQTSKTIIVAVNGDTMNEDDETYTVKLSNVNGAIISKANGAGVINNNDAIPTLSISDVTVDEGTGTTTDAEYTVTLSAASGKTVTVDYATADGTTISGNDYVAKTGSLTFLSGETTKTITIAVVADNIDEDDENYSVNLSNANHAILSKDVGNGIITDDEATPNISIADVSVTEGNSGSKNAAYMVVLSGPSSKTITVDYETNDVSAIAGNDYTSTSGTLTFNPGDTSKTLNIAIKGDTIDEIDETYTLNFSNPNNAGLSNTLATGTIVDNDDEPTISINNRTITEGNGSNVNAVFNVSLRNPSGKSITVDYETADGSAVQGSDYTAKSGQLVFNPGEDAKTITILTSGDIIDEDNETFTVTLDTASNATLAVAAATGTINDNDTSALSIDDVIVEETDSGTVDAVYTVTLSTPSSKTVQVDYATNDGSAEAGKDYTNTNGTLVFTTGQTSKTITVAVLADTIDEIEEGYTVNLSNESNATIIDGSGSGTITDNDPEPNLSINDITASESDANASFTVSLDEASGKTITVDYATGNATAHNGDDYVATTGTITFNPGDSSKTISIGLTDDSIDEEDETFIVTLSSASNAGISDATGTATLTDDDSPPALSINDVSIIEGNTATKTATFTVTLDAASAKAISVDYATAEGSAGEGNDFTATTGTLSFAAGETSKTFGVSVKGDTIIENDETYSVVLLNANNATLTIDTGTGTITDDEPLPTLSIGNATTNEGNSGSTTATFTVTLSEATEKTITVQYETQDDSAAAGSDYSHTSGTLTFNPGDTSQTFSVEVLGELTDEDNETYKAVLINPVGATLAVGSEIGTGEIVDDDTPTLSINNVAVEETDGSISVNFVHTVTLSAASSKTVTVDFATADDTASSPQDYAAQTGSLSFSPGETEKFITIIVAGDDLDEINESYTVSLSNPSNAILASADGVGSIIDNDGSPTLTINDVISVDETGTVDFIVSLSSISGQEITVDYATANDTALAGNDYTAITGTLTFAAGELSKIVSVNINGDSIDEENEKFTLNLSGATNASISDSSGEATITDDDPEPNISVNNVTVLEGDSGTVGAGFTLTLDKASGKTITVNYNTTDNDTTAGTDYNTASGSITFNPGVTSWTITIAANGDELDEVDETFNLNLTGAVNAGITDNQGIATITDDDTKPIINISNASSTDESGSLTFTVTLSIPSGQTVTVNYATANGNAVAGSDYTSKSDTLSFAPGEVSKIVVIAVSGDSIDEENETFSVNLSGPVNGEIFDGNGTGTITDDDPAPTLSINDVNGSEGNSGSGNFNFAVSLSEASERVVTVNYATVDDTAVNSSDYNQTSGTLTFSPGQTIKTIPVAVNGDPTNEEDETFQVVLSGASNAGIANDTGVATIENDDNLPTLTIDDVTINETDSSTDTATFTVTLSDASSKEVTVDYTTADTSTTANNDYVAQSNTLTFAVGETSKSINVTINGDIIDEEDEVFTVNLSNPTNATVDGDGIGEGTITDNDDAPTLSINDVIETEGNLNASFTISLSEVSGKTVTVQYTTVDGNTTEDVDYSKKSGTITFNPGELNQTVDIAIINDTVDELDENYSVTLNSPNNATIADGTGLGTITDNDDPPSLTINDVSLIEGDSGSFNASFIVTLSLVSGKEVTVDYATGDNTANEGSDYTSTTGTLSFAAGETSKTIDVAVLGDVADEGEESFIVTLSSASNATIGDATGNATITDDDDLPTLSINDAVETEGDSGSTDTSFTVTLSEASTKTVTVDYNTADGNAVAGNDYTTAAGTLSFSPGETSKTFSVAIKGDTTDEVNETYSVVLSNASNASISDGNGQGTITDNDPEPNLSIDDVTTNEGSSGTVIASYTVTLDAISGKTVQVDFSTADGTAKASEDYTANSGTLTFNPGVTTQTISVEITSDALDEADTEDYTVALTNASNATITDGSATGSITDDDPPPQISVNSWSVDEGDSGVVNKTFTVSLSAASSKSITVDYETSGGSATAGSDYSNVADTLTFTPGQTNKNISIDVNGDEIDEAHETIHFNLSNASNAIIATATGVGTITDDDVSPTISIADKTTVDETGNISFSISLNTASGRTVAVDYASGDTTATAGEDYTADTGTISFAPDEVSKTIDFAVITDTLDEDDETFVVSLSSPSNATIADGSAIGTITDDDVTPTLSIDDVSFAEGDSGTEMAIFTVSLSAASGKTVTVDYASSDVETTVGDDYLEKSGSLTFAAGDTEKTISVAIKEDSLDEVDETFQITLSNESNATLAKAVGIGTITDDDAEPTMSIIDMAKNEGNSGSANLTFTVNIDAASGKTITVDYATIAVSAIDGTDYNGVAGSLSFSPGQTTKTIDVEIIGDALDEINETFTMELTNVNNAGLPTPTATATITDDDAEPVLEIDDITVMEGDTGTTTASYTVTLSAESSKTVTVNYTTVDVTTIADKDYTTNSGTLTFDPGDTTKTIDVLIAGDTLNEIDETYTVTLSGANNAGILKAVGSGKINNDDVVPTLSIDDVTLTEGDSGTLSADFTVSLSAASGKTVTVDFATGNSTATAGTDYEENIGSLTFASEKISKTISVVVHGDAIDEPNETFNVTLSSANHATLADATGIGQIKDDDDPPQILISNPTTIEGDAGSTSTTCTISLSSVSGKTISVDYATSDDSATVGNDYTATSGTLTFNPGDTEKTFNIAIKGDIIDEIDETYTITLSNENNATLANPTGIGTIEDDDPLPTLSINNKTITEGDSGSKNMVFTVSQSVATEKTVNIDYTTTDVTTTTGVDYVANAGTLTFSPGDTSNDITVIINGDTTDEINETFQIDLSNEQNAILTTPNGTGTITDNDDPPTMAIQDANLTEGDSGNDILTFTVEIDAVSGKEITVNYATSDGTAKDGSDYSAKTGTLTFAAGVTTQNIEIDVTGDTIDEIDEQLTVSLSDVNNAVFSDNTAIGTINDNDDPPSLSIDSITENEGDSATTDAVYTVTLSSESGKEITVDYTTVNGSAIAGDDYTTNSGSLTFTAGQISKNITVVLTGETTDEIDETYSVVLSNASNATISIDTGNGIITNDDNPPTISIDDITSAEGDSGSNDAIFTVNLSEKSGKTITVDYTSTEGSAKDGIDFTGVNDTLTFNPGDTSKTIHVPILGDTLDEEDTEDYTINLSGQTNASLAKDTGAGTITDDDDPPTISISDFTTITEGGNGSESNASFTISLSAESSKDISVDYATADDSATAPQDYTAATDTLTFIAGETSKTITISVQGDALNESQEVYFVNLSNAINASILDAQGEGSITDDDALPALSIDDVVITEGDSGTVNAEYTVTLTPISGREVTVNFTTNDGTAEADSDYATNSGSLSFAAGETSKTITILTTGDTTDEENETYTVTLSGASNATIATDTGNGTITDDDDPPTISVNDVATAEGDSGTKDAGVTVSLSAVSGKSISVQYQTADGSAGSSDYSGGSGTITISAGETTKTISITLSGDQLDEEDESFTVTIDTPINVTIADDTATVTISDDDDPPVVSISSETIAEGDTGSKNVSYTISLDAISSKEISVDYSTADGSATVSGNDYTETSGSFTFLAGQDTKSFTVEVKADTLDEEDETYSVVISNPVNASIVNDTATGTITDDDDPPTLTISDISITEGTGGTTAAEFNISLSSASGREIQVDYETADDSAVSGSDYSALTDTLTIPAGNDTALISISVNADTSYEDTESFLVNLNNPSNVTISDNQARATITDDDTPPTVAFTLPSSNSEDESAVDREIAVSLSEASGKTITVDVRDEGTGSASAGSDYTTLADPITLTFTPGQVSQNVTIPILADLLFEDDETIAFSLSNPVNATLATQTDHVYTIVDDDVGITSAETLDADNDGQIDHYRLTFNKAVNDASFPGYSLDSIGTGQSKWLVSGFSDVVLAHGSAAPETDTTNDAILYLKMTESSAFDTGTKPDLTTLSDPELTATDGDTIAQIFTANVIEADRARPIVVATDGKTGDSNLTITFSEPVYGAIGTPACGSGGELVINSIDYVDVSSGGADSLSAMSSDSCAVDNTASYVMATNFNSGDHNTDTVAASANVYDAADNIGNTTPLPLTITVGPEITAIHQYDVDNDGKIDQMKVSFSTAMEDNSITDTEAGQFSVGGIALQKIDSSAGGSGTILLPNDDSASSDDSIITIFTDDMSITGTDKQSMAFTKISGKWLGSGVEVDSVADLSSVIVDKAPPVILTAVAAENTTAGADIDSDDTLTLTFSEPTNKPVIDNSNIASILALSSSHSWGDISSAIWNGAGDELVITFAGSGSPTISIGDSITILSGIYDTATAANTSVNLTALNPISGDFEVEIPVVQTVSSLDVTTVRVSFSQPVNEADATAVANYKIADSSNVSGSCSDNSNFSSASSSLAISFITKIDDSTYDLTTATQVDGNSYTLLADKSNIHHKDYPSYSIDCPNHGNFIGQEKLTITDAHCVDLQSVVLTFSKPVKAGVNIANSAECDSVSECSKRYAIKGAVSSSEIGDITTAKILDGIVCGGLTANDNKVCLNHNKSQGGKIYALVAANNSDGDGFDNTSFGAILDDSESESIQASPKDRASFKGCGTTPYDFSDGPVVADPFAENSDFGQLITFDDKIYIGSNQNGGWFNRFESDLTDPEIITFEINRDSTGNRTSASSASAPFASIGNQSCGVNNAGISGCGPDNENGRSFMATATVSGSDYIFFSGAKSTGNNDYLYYTSDSDSVWNFDYMDASWTFDDYSSTCNASWSSTITDNKMTDSLHAFNDRIYWSSPGGGSERPLATKISTISNEISCGSDGSFINMRYMTGVGSQALSGSSAQADVLGGHFSSFKDRVYFMNSGSLTYSKPGCKEGDSYVNGSCEQDGGIVRSINNIPADCTSSSCSDWLDITPSAENYRKFFTIGLSQNTEWQPAQKPIPASAEFENQFYFIRNACSVVLWDDGTADGGDSNDGCGFADSNCSNDMSCPAGSEIPQLWKCDPTLSGDASECDADDWSLVAENSSSGKTNFGDSNNSKITMLAKNGDYLYVGFDNTSSGIEIWRTNVANPASESDFSQIGGDGLGSGTDVTEIYSQTSQKNGSSHYLYLSVGKNNQPLRVYRQQNSGPVALLDLKHSLEKNALMAYISNHADVQYSLIALLGLFAATFVGWRIYSRQEEKDS